MDLIIIVIIILLFILIIVTLVKYNHYSMTLVVIFVITLLALVLKQPIRILYAASCPIVYYVRTPPFLHDSPSGEKEKLFPQYIKFEEPNAFEKIKSEINNIIQHKRKDLVPVNGAYGDYNNDIVPLDINDTQKVLDAGWKLLPIKSGNYTNYKHCPFIASLVKNDENIVSCIVSILEPRTRIPIHIGYYKGVIRYLLGVIIPKDREQVFLCANGEKRNWTEGKGLLFDDTFPHKVYNNTDETRVVLYMDVRRKLDNKVLNSFNNWVVDRAMDSEMVKKEARETEKKYKINT